MIQFTPKSGRLELEVFHDENASPNRFLAFNLRITFAEKMDPDDPRDDDPASAEIDAIPIPLDVDWQHLEGSQWNLSETGPEDLTEGAIYYYGYHNPIDVEKVSFGKLQKDGGSVKLEGTIDFTYEGLSRFGKPNIVWDVPFTFDKAQVQATLAEFQKGK